ncbi:MAG: NAD-dependent epimerase/dehydratase family protein [Caldilineaceae bacterium]
MELRNTTALITGATGYIGGRLAQRLITEEGMQVRALVRTPSKAQWLAELGCEIAPGDITDPSTIRQAITGCQVVFHAAAWVSERGQRAEIWAVNVTGTQHLVDAAVAAQVQRFVQVSSCAVYGSQQRFNIDETTPTRLSGNLYADSKVEAEEVVWRAYRENKLPIAIARASQVYGLGSPQFTVRPVEMIQKGKMLLIDGGRHLCKPIYIDNLVDGLILCAKVDAAIGQAFNFSDGAPVPWRDFFGAYAKMFGKTKLPSVPYPVAWLAAVAAEAQGYITGKPARLNRRVFRSLRSNNSFSNQKAQLVLGWKPRVDLQTGMQQTEKWLRDAGYIRER